MKKKKAPQSKIPTHLFHYTNPDACIKIVQNREFWATKIEYMNDSKEVRHAAELAMKLVSSEPPPVPEIKEAVTEMLKNLDGAATYVVSFSRNEDKLSQWRAYCGNGGISIGFCYKELIKTLDASGNFQLQSCIYKEAEQIKEIKKEYRNFMVAVKTLKKERPRLWPGFDVVPWVYDFFGRSLYKLAARIKHESFEEEAEWRLIVQPRNPDQKLLGWRAGADMIVPYYRYVFGESCPIYSLCSGPARQPEEAKRAIASLAINERLGAYINTTKTPYRKN